MTTEKTRPSGAQTDPKPDATAQHNQRSNTGTENDLLPELGLKRPAPPEPSREEATGNKATQFDGNPNPKGVDAGVLGPKDDTPAFLEKKSGPATDRK